jgi:hypothetical protein
MLKDPTTGRFLGPSKTPEQRFWPKVRKTKGCWRWTAATSPLGYGYFWDGNRLVLAHRFCYELVCGPIPAAHDLDHLCRNPNCVNPDHLEPVLHQVNIARGNAGLASGAQQRAKTACPRGHPYSPDNTYAHPTSGSRCCRECRRLWGLTPDRRKAAAARQRECRARAV